MITDASYLGEISEYFRHFITTFSAAHVDDDITVGVLRQGLRDHSFTTTESTRDGCGSSLHTPVKLNSKTKRSVELPDIYTTKLLLYLHIFFITI